VTIQLVLTIIEIAALVGVLAIYLTVIGNQLRSICASLARITFGVRAVETMCAVIGPAVERINGNLDDICQNLQNAAIEAEKLSR
jgi:hypothetical protein